MGRTIAMAIAEQPIGNCRWSRPGYRLFGIESDEQPESLWACVRRTRTRRPVTEAECADCAYWEPDAERPTC